jgi:hypothetical protein
MVGRMKLYHCFHDEPKPPWEVWLPLLTVERAHPDDRERLAAYLAECARYGETPDAYYAAETPLWGYGPYVQIIEAPDEVVFRGQDPGEYILPSDRIESADVYFNLGTDHGVENAGYPIWREEE